ncbi:MAG: hypothetical protein ACOX18_03335 [Bacillota bacterium]|jgi:hypothetical protein
MRITFCDHRILFLVFSALNHNGYDLEGNPEMHPLRIYVREQLAGLPENDYFRQAAAGWPRANWLGATALCLGDDLQFTHDPTPLWDEIDWESPEPLDGAARAWLGELPEHLTSWEQQPRVAALWPEYLGRIREAETPGLRQEIVKLVEQRLSLLPQPVEHALTVLPNYLQSDWSADPVRVSTRHYIILGPLSLRLADSILHELLHEYFGPLLEPLRPTLGRAIRLLEPDHALLARWGYWHVSDANKTVYKVLQECCVRAAMALLLASSIDTADWGNYGLNLAYPLYAHFRRQGYFSSAAEVEEYLLSELSAAAATSAKPASQGRTRSG